MPNWKKVITSGSDAVLNEITSSGGIKSTDVNIDDWGSVSASLASLDASIYGDSDVTNHINSLNVVSGSSQITISNTTGYTTFSSSIASDIAAIDSNVTLDDATTNGNSTTNDITASGFLVNGTNNQITNRTYDGSVGVDEGAIVLEPRTAGGETGITFASKQNEDSDYGYLWWYDDNDNYAFAGGSEENSALILGIQNDFSTSSFGGIADAVVLESAANIFFNVGLAGAPGGVSGSDFTKGKVYVGHADEAFEIWHEGNFQPTGSTLQQVTDYGSTTTNSVTVGGLNISSVSNAGVDTDKFLVLDSAGNVDFRTGAQVLSDIGGLELNGGNLTPLQTYIDFKGLSDGHISFGGVIDPMPLDRWMGVWIAPSDGYIDHIRISPENDNSTTGNVDLQLYVNATANGSAVSVAMGAAGVNKKFTFGSSYSFSEDDRISIHMNKNGNSSDLYAIQIVYRLTN